MSEAVVYSMWERVYWIMYPVKDWWRSQLLLAGLDEIWFSPLLGFVPYNPLTPKPLHAKPVHGR